MSARLHRREFTTTRSGIVIGSAFVPRRELREVTRSEEQVQTVLLARPRRFERQPIVVTFIGAVVAVFVVLHLFGRV